MVPVRSMQAKSSYVSNCLDTQGCFRGQNTALSQAAARRCCTFFRAATFTPHSPTFGTGATGPKRYRWTASLTWRGKLATSILVRGRTLVSERRVNARWFKNFFFSNTTKPGPRAQRFIKYDDEQRGDVLAIYALPFAAEATRQNATANGKHVSLVHDCFTPGCFIDAGLDLWSKIYLVGRG